MLGQRFIREQVATFDALVESLEINGHVFVPVVSQELHLDYPLVLRQRVVGVGVLEAG
jgi:uncharacterized protein YebE (UPF0316 family)